MFIDLFIPVIRHQRVLSAELQDKPMGAGCRVEGYLVGLFRKNILRSCTCLQSAGRIEGGRLYGDEIIRAVVDGK